MKEKTAAPVWTAENLSKAEELAGKDADDYGFSFFAKQNSQLIRERAKHLPQDEYDTFLSGFKTNNDFIIKHHGGIQ